MKFRSLIALATAITAVAANGKPKGPQGDTVPGNNGFRYCKDEDYPIQFNIVDIEPLNVSAYANVTIYATGISNVTLTEDAIVDIKIERPPYYPDTYHHPLCDIRGMQCPNNKFEFALMNPVGFFADADEWIMEINVMRNATVHQDEDGGKKKKKKKKGKKPKKEVLGCISSKFTAHKGHINPDGTYGKKHSAVTPTMYFTTITSGPRTSPSASPTA